MKLLPRTEVKSDAQASLNALYAKEAIVSKAIQEKLNRLNEMEADYAIRLSAKRSELGEEEMKFKRFVAGREEIVKALETRKEEAMKPIDWLITEVRRKKEEVESELFTLKDRESELTEAIRNWKAKDDEVFKELAKARKTRSEAEALSEKIILKANGITDEAKRKLSVADWTLKEAAAQQTEIESKVASMKSEQMNLEALKISIETEKQSVLDEHAKVQDDREKLKQALLIMERKYGKLPS